MSSMDVPSRPEVILSKMNQFYRINEEDPDDRIKFALKELLLQWSDVLIAANEATAEELFYLNVSRGFLSQIFGLVLVKDCFINDHSFMRDIMQICFDLLMEHIDASTSEDCGAFLMSNIRLIMEISSNLMSFLWSTDIDLIDEQLFLAMREYVDQDSTNEDFIEEILMFIWNVSDNTSLVPILLKANYPKSLFEWIKVSPKKFREDQQNALINILQNMLRHDDALEQFNNLQIWIIIEKMQFKADLSLFLSMIHVLLTDKNQIKLESLEFLNKLIQLTINAGTNERYRHDGSHVCELLTVLAKFFYNDEILHMILKTQSSIIEFAASLLVKLYPSLGSDHDPLENSTCILLFNILCCISYHQEYIPMISNNEQLMNIIEKAAINEKNFIDTSTPRTMKSIEQTAIEILKNLNEKYRGRN